MLSRGSNRYAEGSALLEMGNTQIYATVSLEHRVPMHVRGTRKGWLMAEYNMLPRASHDRSHRERTGVNGRTQEIQRLLGRAFRLTVDLEMFKDKTIIVDCDVLQADGGTRVASILAGYAALFDFSDKLVRKGVLNEWPLLHEIGALSVGLVDGEIRLDLDYSEDVRAEADFNVIATNTGRILEVQGGSEKDPLAFDQFQKLVQVGVHGVQKAIEELRPQLNALR